MIRLFDKSETNFNHNATILQPLFCYVLEEANGMFELEAEFPKTIDIPKGSIIKAPSPRGEQLFRIYRTVRTLKGRKIYAKHIFYDLANNFILDIRPTGSCQKALDAILNNTAYDTGFTAGSDVGTLTTAYYIRKNAVQTIIGADNSVLNTWGGNLIRNNHSIDIKAKGIDRGYEIRLGKNLVSIEDDSDISLVKTRLYPTIVLGDSSIVYSLPEKYVDSPLLASYGQPRISEVRVELTEEEMLLPLSELYEFMRIHCNRLFVDGLDKPIINYKIDFVELSKTEQYKHFAILEQLDLFDIITINVTKLGIDIKASLIKYSYDSIKERFRTIELGNFTSLETYKTSGIVNVLQRQISDNTEAINIVANLNSGNLGGYIVQRRNPDGTPYEMIAMDTPNIDTAKNIVKINKEGISFGNHGYTGAFGVAITIDGSISADYMNTSTLTGILLQSENYQENVCGTLINLQDGIIDSPNFKVSSEGTITAVDGNFSGVINASTFQGGEIRGTNIIGSRFEWSNGTAWLDTTAQGTPELYGSKYVKIESGDKILINTVNGLSLQGGNVSVWTASFDINCPITVGATGDWSYLRSIETHHIYDKTAGSHNIGSDTKYFNGVYYKTLVNKSDARLKENVVSFADYDWLRDVNLYSYNYIGDNQDEIKIGILANEHENTNYSKYFVRGHSEQEMLSINQDSFMMAFLKYIQEVDKRVMALERD